MKKFYIFQYKDIKCNNLLRYFFLIMIILSHSVANAGTGNLAQIIKEKRVTINAVNQKLDKILSDINTQSKVEYGYQSNDDINKNQLFSLSVKNVTVEEALIQLFKGSQYSFRVVDNKLVIYKIKEVKPQPTTGKKVSVAGKVIDKSTNTPIGGATVIVESTGAGAITDESGKFMLIVNDGLEYEISYVGMKSYKAKAAQTSGTITIALERDALAVDDVVVTGYQTLSRLNTAGSAFVLEGDELLTPSLVSLDQMLQGKIPGMMVMNTSGEPSATPKIRVRGNSTLNGNQAPVWVVDGVILEQAVPFNAADINSDDAAYLIGSAIAGLNPQDVETITVLKDASATAIYGVKAANGVIVITTKKGKIGRPIVTYSGDVIINQRPSYNNFDRMNSAQRVQLSSEIYDAGIKYDKIPIGDSYEGAMEELFKKKITQDEFNKKVVMLQGRNTDWFKELFRNSVSHTHNINVSGGTTDVKYYFSAGYNKNQGAALKSDNERFTSMGKVDVTLN
ncbi:MAG: carboxypeptidase-like regulatory domain-containing protein, partial [Rikenellaceae bacterium]